MKRKQIELLQPIKTRKKGKVATIQTMDNVLIINFFVERELNSRYCINADTGEHEYWHKTAGWKKAKLITCWTGKYEQYYSVWKMEEYAKKIKLDKKDADAALEFLHKPYTKSLWSAIGYAEEEYDREKRWNTEERRKYRLHELMCKIPDSPEDIRDWIFHQAAGEDYMIWDRNKKDFGCTNCGGEPEERELKRVDGERKIRHNDLVKCPYCGKEVLVKKRTGRISKKTVLYLIQPVDEGVSVIRVFDVEIQWEYGYKSVCLDEGIRIMAYKDGHYGKNKKRYDIYYKQYCSYDFDRGNNGNRHAKDGYLYPGNIIKTLENTAYASTGRLLEQMAQTRTCINYNNILYGEYGFQNYSEMLEYLFKCRFRKLLKETVDKTEWWGKRARYYGSLYMQGDSIETVMGLEDRQKINRIRDMNGGEKELEWMRWSEEHDKKIPQDTLIWMVKNKIKPGDIKESGKYMNPQQIQNYINKQKVTSYPGLTQKEILEQWEDYLQMCKAVGKKINDEMIYRPRELKRRHDEVVTDINKLQIIKSMGADKEYNEKFSEEMREKYPNAERTMRDIKERYEYEGEEYFIRVPKNLIEIIEEGQALHHCAGSTERYFDRIENQETYICFLRRKTEPEIPYYTIEIEPGGTIRQHRSYLDEEPGIDEIRGFLKEWQQTLKKRLTREDKRLAKISAVKRYENIEDLKKKNNTRVLKALEEDFLENVLEEAI